MTVAEELESLRLEREKLELEDLRFRVREQQNRKEQRAMERRQLAATFAENEREQRQRQESCQHRKGGKDESGFLNGNDSNFSIIKHTYPDGQMEVMCTRCEKTYRKPSAALMKTDPKAAKAMLAEFRMVWNWPTDNMPSGSQLFLIHAAA